MRCVVGVYVISLAGSSGPGIAVARDDSPRLLVGIALIFERCLVASVDWEEDELLGDAEDRLRWRLALDVPSAMSEFDECPRGEV